METENKINTPTFQYPWPLEKCVVSYMTFVVPERSRRPTRFEENKLACKVVAVSRFWMRETDSATDDYSALQKCLGKVNPDCSALFQYPKRNWSQEEKEEEDRPLAKDRRPTLCVNKLSAMISKADQLGG